MLKFALLPMLCGCVLLIDAPMSSSEEPAPNCAEPQTQMDMTICAGEDFIAADEALNSQYQETRKQLKARDADAVSEDLKGSEAALLAAQRAWIVYRDTECASRGFQARGGSMEPMLISSCKADLTRKRTEDLKSLTETM
jgi:uncharacterized protein YecT (DUF1311 family)